MAMINNKQGFVFTFLSLFIVLLIYLFAQTNLQEENYSLQNEFEEARIEELDRELQYFKSSYLDDALEISFDATITQLMNLSEQDSSFYNSYTNNYSRFNDLVYEGIKNGSFNGVDQTPLQDKKLSYLVNEFENNYETDQKTDFEFSLNSIAVYEKIPFHLTIQANYNISSESNENLGLWNSSDTIVIQRPLFDNYEPQHLLTFNLGSNAPVLDTVENRFTSNVNWSLSVFNESINDQLTTTYSHPDYKYTLGTSFLRGLFEDYSGSYKNTVGFWSFDYDREEGGVYDTSQKIDNGEYFGSSKLLFNFNDDDGTTIVDSSDYQNNGTLNGSADCSIDAISGQGCEFDGSDDYITSDNVEYGVEDNSSFSYSFWIKTDSTGSQETLIGKTDNAFEEGSSDSNLHLIKDTTGVVSWRLEFNGSNNEDTLQGNTSIDDNQWHYITAIRNGWNFKLYVDGQLDEQFEKDDYYIDNGETQYNKALNSNSNVDIGAYRPTSSPGSLFDGILDEVGVYDKALTNSEISQIYEEQKAKFIEYKDSYHGKNAHLKKDNTIEIFSGNNYSTLFQNDFTLEAWFIPTNSKGTIFNYPNQINLSYDISSNELILSDYNFQITTPVDLSQKYPNFVTISYDDSSDIISIYNNDDKILESSSSWAPSGSGGDRIIFGSGLEGSIDEIRLLNTTTTHQEVMRNYFNYKSEAKGCCNYLLPINPAKTGFNSSSYDDLTSYSTTVFSKYHFDGQTDINLTLYNITNITSQEEDTPHYNFLVDVCQILAYDIFSYSDSGDAARDVNTGFDGGNCEPLIDKGIY